MDSTALDALAARIGSTVHAKRTALGWSLGELSRASGLSKTILARIERGDGNPSIETLWRVSGALGVPLGELLAPAGAPRVRAIPAGSGDPLAGDAGMVARLLHADAREHRAEHFVCDFPKGTDQRTDAHLPGTEEVILCLKGRMRVGPYDEEVELRAGDAVWFTADVPHHYVALRESRTLCIMSYISSGGPGPTRP